MSKIRAYKLAEELGIDKNDLVERAGTVGIELKGPMAALEVEQADLLRSKFGERKTEAVVESRVESRAGRTVIRRRKKAAAPEPEAPDAAEIEAVPTPIRPVESAETPSVTPAVETPAPTPDAGGEPPAVVEPIAAAAESPAAGPGTKETPAPRPAAAATPAQEQTGDGRGAAGDKKGRARKRVREVVNLKEQEQFARQVTGRGAPRRQPTVIDPRSMVSPRRRRRDAPAPPVLRGTVPPAKKAVRVDSDIVVGELAKELGIKAAQLQGKLMALGTMVSVTQTVNVTVARQVAEEYGFEVVDTGFKESEYLEAPLRPADEGDEGIVEQGEPRPPVITVMGHVDHGKTSLLDALRETDKPVTDDESGGITQHIGAYQIDTALGKFTFIDTPGHAAFTAMRARGAKVTDIVVLVVAATEGVMPQTTEAIDHAKAAGCPIVVAINKCDLPGADPMQTRQLLMQHDLVAEDFGGEVLMCEVSALKREGLDKLLEALSLQAEVLELRADPSKRGAGVVLEARMEKGRGAVATLLVKDGSLRSGDSVVVGTEWGRLRTLEDDTGHRIKVAGPSAAVQIAGLSGIPEAGAAFHAVESDRVAKQIVSHREDKERARPVKARPRLTLEEFFAQSEGEGARELRVVLKADVQGTCEAVRDSLEKLSTDAVTLTVLSSGIGAITENDVTFAKASDAVVVGFHVRPDSAARREADTQGIEIRSYTVIMNLLDEIKAAMAGLLPPTQKEVMLGAAEVRQPFTIPRIGTIAGSYITEGLVRRNAPCRLIRDGVQVYEGKIGSLRRFKDDVREVASGYECGIGIEGYNDVKVGDVIEAYEIEEHPATL